jgi:hypothetical protein
MFNNQIRDGLALFHYSERTRTSGQNICFVRKISLNCEVCLAETKQNLSFIFILQVKIIRFISISRLKPLLALHLIPINDSSCRNLMESTDLEVGFLLRCFQQLSTPYVATQRFLLVKELVHQRYVPSGPLVLC